MEFKAECEKIKKVEEQSEKGEKVYEVISLTGEFGKITIKLDEKHDFEQGFDYIITTKKPQTKLKE